jgi:hypothetical protein
MVTEDSINMELQLHCLRAKEEAVPSVSRATTMKIARECGIRRHVRVWHANTVDVFFVCVRAIEPVIVPLRIGVVFVVGHIMLHYAIQALKNVIDLLKRPSLM